MNWGNKTKCRGAYWAPKIRSNLLDHFIECLVLKRLNVVPSDPPAFFRELLPTNEFEDLIFWPSVVLSKSKLWKECDSLAKNILQTNHFCPTEDILPPQFAFLTDKDYAKIVERLQNYENGVNLRATEDYSVVFEHPQLVDSWLRLVDGFVRERAAKDAPELRKAHLDAILGTKRAEAKGAKGAEKQQQKDDWEVDRAGGKKVNKSAGAKKGGGAGKGAAGKRKGGTESDAQAKYDPLSTARLPTDELFDELRRAVASSVSDGLPESLCAELEEEFGSAANKMYRECLGEEYKKVDFGEQQGLREIYEQKVAKFSETYADICLYEKGTEIFEENESLFGDLRTFLLRTLCTELSLSLLHAVAEPSSSQQAPQKFTQKQREQLIANLESKEAQKLAKELFDGLDSVEHFHEAVQRFASHGGAMLRQPDKRERSNRLDKFGTELRSQLADCSDPPTLLLLAVLLTLKKFFGVAVHASGKFVSPLILFISSKANKVSDPSLSELRDLLMDTQRLVVACIRKERSNEGGAGGGGAEEREEEKEQLTARMECLKTFFAENELKSDI
uniref:E3 UFM1-protein ligase 1 homolog n=1 Tax=Globodera rostochiensis TaxID=31243 RepID=A0A914GYF3_GLORO